MTSFVQLAPICVFVHVSYAWTSMGAGGMSGVTYASGTIYNVGTMCPNNVNQGYVCDGRNFGDKYLNPGTVSAFCSGYTSFATSKQYGFGHGVTASQKCGECGQIRVPRLDGTYNYMTVMMVDHFTWSMEVGTTEIEYLVEGTKWVVGDRADFDFRIVDDCYASFGDDISTPSNPVSSPTPRPTPVPFIAPTPTIPSNGGGDGSSTTTCSVSSNWGSMKINPYWGSSASSLYAVISNPPDSITSFEIKGYGQSDNQYHSCVLQNVNSYQCDMGSALAEPASVRLNGGSYIGNNIIVSMTGSAAKYPLSSCGSSSGGSSDTSSTSSTSTTTTTTTTTASSGGGSSGSGITVHIYSDDTWWTSFFLSNYGTNDITSIKVRGAGQSAYYTATVNWVSNSLGPVYACSPGPQMQAPLEIKLVRSDGQEISGATIQQRAAGASATFGGGFVAEDTDNDDDTLSWTAYFAIIICLILVLIGCIVGFICYKKKKTKKEVTFDHGTDKEIEIDDGIDTNTQI